MPATAHPQPAALDLPFPALIRPGGQAHKLLVLLHGVGGNAHSLQPLLPHVPDDWLVVCLRAPLQIGPEQYAWFNVSFASGTPVIVASEADSSRRWLDDAIAQLQAQTGIAPAHTVVAGFSQGGILSASLALSVPERVAGFGILSGRILPEIEAVLAPPARLARLQGWIGHGEQDTKLPIVWAERADAWLRELGVAHSLHRYACGHGIAPEMLADFLHWLQRSRCNTRTHITYPQGVVTAKCRVLYFPA